MEIQNSEPRSQKSDGQFRPLHLLPDFCLASILLIHFLTPPCPERFLLLHTLVISLDKSSACRQRSTAGCIEGAIAKNIEVGIDDPALIASIFGMADSQNPAGHGRELNELTIFHIDSQFNTILI